MLNLPVLLMWAFLVLLLLLLIYFDSLYSTVCQKLSAFSGLVS
jgi:hypothetical protein